VGLLLFPNYIITNILSPASPISFLQVIADGLLIALKHEHFSFVDTIISGSYLAMEDCERITFFSALKQHFLSHLERVLSGTCFPDEETQKDMENRHPNPFRTGRERFLFLLVEELTTKKNQTVLDHEMLSYLLQHTKELKVDLTKTNHEVRVVRLRVVVVSCLSISRFLFFKLAFLFLISHSLSVLRNNHAQ
jgi:hypothetical protein